MRRSVLAWVVAGIAVPGLGCSATPKAEPKVEELADEVCSLAYRCCDRNETSFLFGPYVDGESCADRLVRRSEIDPMPVLQVIADSEPSIGLPNLAALDRAVRDGRVKMDNEALEQCVTHLQELSCNGASDGGVPDGGVPDGGLLGGCPPPPPSEVEEEELPCSPDLLFTGNVAEGGTCTSGMSSLECEEGLTCRTDPDLGVEGQCVALGAEGEPCSSEGECGEDLYCSLLDGTCRPFRSRGETCAYSDRDSLTPDPATALLRCEPGLFCDPITDLCVTACERGAPCIRDEDCDEEQELQCIAGRCDRPRPAGLPCAEDDDCQEGLRCGIDPEASEPLPICLERLAVGEACTRHADCDSEFCDSETGMCAPAVEANEPCPSGEDAQCGGEAICDTSFVFCSTDDDCPSPRACNDTTGRCEPVCVARLPDGAMCTTSDECASSNCVAGFCRTLPLAEGQSCEADFQCETSFCSLGDTRVCATLPLPDGRRCASGSQCESGLCWSSGVEPERCVTGAMEGAACGEPGLLPCNPGSHYCDDEQSPPACARLGETGEPCERSEQCRGACIVRFGRQMCSQAPPPDGALCDGRGGGGEEMGGMSGGEE